MVKASSFAAAAAAAFASVASAGMQSPKFPTDQMFQVPMGMPPVKTPRFTFTSPQTGAPIDYFEMDMKPLSRKQYPNLGPARMLGYDGNMPGPTFHMTQGREAVVRFVNHADRAISVHLHGSYSRTPFDGYADDVTPVGWYKDYYYPNRQNARTLWYHDHAVDHTAENVFFGLAGFYVLHDPDELALGLPQDKYDIPFGIMARRYNSDGTLWDPELNGETTSVYGDVIEVNGVPWPHLVVEPRKYRFRFLDMGISRTYMLFLQADQQNDAGVNFTMIGSDAGLLARSVSTSVITMSIAERWEAIIDFAPFANQNLTLRNMKGVGADQDFDNTQVVMKFLVGGTVTDEAGNGPVPAILRDVPFPPGGLSAPVNRHFKFHHSGQWLVNDIGWNDGLPARLIATPARGNVEVWQLQNGGGGWSHPVHIHLIDFQVIARTGSNRGVLPFEAAALQDVVWLGPGETVTVIARFAPWPGEYMIHCHNLIHEDHEMLAEFNVTQVDGQPDINATEFFVNPLEAQYRAVGPFSEDEFQTGTGNFSEQAIHDKVNFFANKKAYQNVEAEEAALAAYWDAKNAKEKRTGKYEHYNMPAYERRDRLQGWWKPKDEPKIKGRAPTLPVGSGIMNLAQL